MTTWPLQHPGETQQYAQSWALSVALHALAITVAVLMVTDLTLAPQPETFRWDVAMVEPPPPAEMKAPSPPTPKAEPSAPAPAPKQAVKKPTPVEKSQPLPAVQRVVQHREVRQTEPLERAPVPLTQQPSQQTQRVVTHDMQSIEVPQETISVPKEVTSRVETYETVRETVAESQPVVQATIQEATAIRQVQETAVQRIEPTVEAVHAPQETAVPTASEPVKEPVVKQTKPIVESNVQSSTVVHEQDMIREQPVTQHVPVHSRPATKADYSWLAEALWSKVDRLKRYPAMARMNRWEGQVVLRAVIRDTGELVDLQIAQSSGHAILDRDAMEVMRKASPITLKHSLGQSQVVLNIPISYKLQ